MEKKRITVLLVLIFLAGLSLLLYPTVSNWWNTGHQSKAIVRYAGEISGMDEAEKEAVWESAQNYNQKLAEQVPRWRLTKEEWAEYESQLDVTGTGIMGYVEIPRISCSLPIYHGTEEAMLASGIGHIEWSSLPVGGESTHCVISGHRGLPSAKLLTDLNRLELGDMFYLHVLEETLAYEVDQIVTVEPDELEELEIQEQRDYCTIVTCTPYGINSHRLLVRGHRVPISGQSVNGIMQEMELPGTFGWKQAWKTGPVFLAPVIFVGWLIRRRRKKKKKSEEEKPSQEVRESQ